MGDELPSIHDSQYTICIRICKLLLFGLKEIFLVTYFDEPSACHNENSQ
jgi:hypothetical protein